jgi:amino acid transporter
LLFPQFAYLSKKRQIPLFGTIVTAIFATIIALFFDISSLTNMISFGTLLAFSMVCGGIVILRFKQPVENNEMTLVITDEGIFFVLLLLCLYLWWI